MNREQQGVDSLSNFVGNGERPNNFLGLICDGYFHHRGKSNCAPVDGKDMAAYAGLRE